MENIENIGRIIRQAKFALLGEIIDIITHQWKQPLNAMGLLTQNIELIIDEDGAIDKKEIKDLTSSIMKHVVGMGEIIDNFKYFFKDTGPSQIFNLQSAIDQALMLFQPVIKKSAIKLNVQKPEQSESITLQGSANEFKQAFLNIMLNSRNSIGEKISRGEAKPGSGIITTKIETHENKAFISIEDNGTGFAPEVVDSVFDIFPSADEENYLLYVSAIIIKKTGGRIWAENRADGGAVVFMELPL